MLHIANVSKNYHKPVLRDIELRVKDGEFLSLLGASGCGKSTLLNLIAGLETPSSGAIYHNENPITGPGTDRSYLFQDAALFPWLDVLGNVKFGMRMAGFSKAEQKERALQYLDMVKLSEYRHFRVHELSGGMKQRVALARALTLDSDILLMDEPFSALDDHNKNELRAHLLDIWKKTGKTIVLVTHSMEEAFSLADRVCVLSSGPARILREYTLPRPRDIRSAEIRGMIEEAGACLAGAVENIAG